MEKLVIAEHANKKMVPPIIPAFLKAYGRLRTPPPRIVEARLKIAEGNVPLLSFE